MAKAKNNYINGPDLHQALLKHLEKIAEADAQGIERPPCTNYIGEAIWLISENLGRKGNFSGYSFLEEMKGDARENCIKYLHTYNPKYSNPFAWLTKITWQAFVRRIQKEKKQQYIKYKMSMQNADILSEHTVEMHLHMTEVVEKFETDNNIKKPKRKVGIEKFTEE